MLKKPRQGGWYVRKYFPHFDLPLDFDVALARVTDPSWISAHPFWPFIGFEDRKRRFRTIDGQKIADTKSRPIKYCAHQDGYIFSFYAYQLQIAYEQYISDRSFNESVIGYRRGVGNNVEMACAAFGDISKRRKSAVICLDISSFFDNIDHVLLRSNLLRVLGVSRLSNDWFAVFRAMSRYSWVDASELCERLQYDEKSPPRPLCSAVEFRTKVRGDRGAFPSLLRTNAEVHGIPQGSPISAVFSNVFMIGFDEIVHDYVARIGGSYRRYSDDIIVICAPSRAKRVLNFIRKEINNLGSAIKISDEKTETSVFERRGKLLACDRPITYLGFTFDGRRVALRGRTLSRYYRRMSYATRHTARKAEQDEAGLVYKRKLYRDLSHLGADNFYSYAKRAAKTMSDPTPKKQLRRHFRILGRKLISGGR